jgi:L-arabinonolactonase
MSAERFSVVDAPVSVLGEGPMWCVKEQCLYWVDIVEKRLFRHRPATGRTDVRAVPYAPSAVIPRAAGGLLLRPRRAWR